MVLCLTGYSCTGKTTVSNFLAESYQYRLISVRNTSHNLAIEQGFTRTREWLKVVSRDEYLIVCRQRIMDLLLNGADNHYIIDDLFDLRLWEMLKRQYKARLISFCLPDQVRRERIQKRIGLGSTEAIQELDFLDAWKKSFGIEDVIRAADISINVVELSTENIVDAMMDYLPGEMQ